MILPPEAAFSAANSLALAGWVALLASPRFPRAAQAVAGAAIPLLLSIAYAGIILASWTRAEGGFGSLADVMRLFDSPLVALAGWIHYLAFDLLVGAAIARSAREEAIAFALVVPCLVLAFLFGPAGFLAFSALRWTRRAARAAATQECRP
ncbi:MAG: ABA4-like family protein [Alphaproteobacteria bacterium]|jgi:hypothetical protein